MLCGQTFLASSSCQAPNKDGFALAREIVSSVWAEQELTIITTNTAYRLSDIAEEALGNPNLAWIRTLA